MLRWYTEISIENIKFPHYPKYGIAMKKGSPVIIIIVAVAIVAIMSLLPLSECIVFIIKDFSIVIDIL